MKKPGVFWKAISSLRYVDDKDPEIKAAIRVLRDPEGVIDIIQTDKFGNPFIPDTGCENVKLARSILAARRVYERGAK